MVDLCEGRGSISDHLAGRWHGRGRLGRLETADQKLGKQIQLVGDDLLVTNVKFVERASREGVQLAAVQAQPDRHADRSDRGVAPGAARGLDRRRVSTAAARPKTRRSPTSSWP